MTVCNKEKFGLCKLPLQTPLVCKEKSAIIKLIITVPIVYMHTHCLFGIFYSSYIINYDILIFHPTGKSI